MGATALSTPHFLLLFSAMLVAAAGNNATSAPLLPAGFTGYDDGALLGSAPAIPLLSIGALNPDGSVALFSNDGSWVAARAPGAALVSTSPLVDSGARAGVETPATNAGVREVGDRRATIDPDSYTGFSTWSGTSFAAPVAAGEAAQSLVDRDVFNVDCACACTDSTPASPVSLRAVADAPVGIGSRPAAWAARDVVA